MNIVRVSLFCVAALLVNGAYAKDFSGSAGAVAKTAEFTLSNSPVWQSRAAAQQEGSAEDRDDLLHVPTRADGRDPQGIWELELPETVLGILVEQVVQDCSRIGTVLVEKVLLVHPQALGSLAAGATVALVIVAPFAILLIAIRGTFRSRLFTEAFLDARLELA